MLLTKRKDKRTELRKEIDENIQTLREMDFGEDYEKQLGIVERLSKIEIETKKVTIKVSPDTIAIIAGNLLGIALILGFEKANVLTSKALGFVMRGRV